MKAIVTLTGPEEKLPIEIDAWARLQFERHSGKHGVPPMPTREAAQRHPEMYMCIASYYALKRAGLIGKLTYDEYEMRWGGISDMDAGEQTDALTDPTIPAQ